MDPETRFSFQIINIFYLQQTTYLALTSHGLFFYSWIILLFFSLY